MSLESELGIYIRVFNYGLYLKLEICQCSYIFCGEERAWSFFQVKNYLQDSIRVSNCAIYFLRMDLWTF